MAFNFNMRKVLKEAAENDPEYCPTGSIDEVLGTHDLQKLFDEICPASGDVCQQLKEQAADPESLRIVFDNRNSNYYMDYQEMVNYCEASGMNVKDAASAIIKHYNEGAGLENFTNESFHLVFPAMESFVGALKGRVGYQDIAWSSHFLSNCINAGIKCVSFEDPGQPNGKTKDVETV